MDPHEIEDAEDQLENYYVKVDGMLRRLLMIAEHIDANEDLVEIQASRGGGWGLGGRHRCRGLRARGMGGYGAGQRLESAVCLTRVSESMMVLQERRPAATSCDVHSPFCSATTPFQMDHRRNELVALDLLVSLVTAAFAWVSMIAGFWG